jgi:hypothetical protein
MVYQNDHGLINLDILNDKGLVKLVMTFSQISHTNLVI